MDIKDSYLHGTRGVVKSISVDADKLTYILADVANTAIDVALPLATTTANGLMSSTDKTKLNSLSTTLSSCIKWDENSYYNINPISKLEDGVIRLSFRGTFGKEIKQVIGIGYSDNLVWFGNYLTNSFIRISNKVTFNNKTLALLDDLVSDNTTVKNYTKATTIEDITNNDSLTTALGKLEYKTDSAYELVRGAYDGDGTIENLAEILKVLEGIKDTETIQAIIGKYLPLTGGTLTGTLGVNSLFRVRDSMSTLYLLNHSGINYIESGNSDFDTNADLSITGINGKLGSNLHLNFTNIMCRGSYTNIDSGNYTKYPVKSPNVIKFKNTKGTTVSYDGSAEVDLTSGVNYATTATRLNNLDTLSYSTYTTVGSVKEKLLEVFGNISYGVGSSVIIPSETITAWNNDDYKFTHEGKYAAIKLSGGYSGNAYGQWLLSSYGDLRLYYVGLYNGEWTPLRAIATTNDLADYVTVSTIQDITGLKTFKNKVHFSPNGDGNMTLYSDHINNDYGYETMCLQTCFDDLDPLTSDLVTRYPLRTVLALQPRGGTVGIGTTTPNQALEVIGNLQLTSKATNKTPKIVFEEYGGSTYGSWTSSIISDYYGENVCATTGFNHGLYIKLGRNETFSNLNILDADENPIARISKVLGHWFNGCTTLQSKVDGVGVSLILKNSEWKNNMSTAMDFYNGAQYEVPNARMSVLMNGNGKAGGTMIFSTQTKHESTNPNTNDLVERMRIDDDGLVKISGALTVDKDVNIVGVLNTAGNVILGNLSTDITRVKGKLYLANMGGSWIDGMINAAIMYNSYTALDDSKYHPILGVKTNDDHVVNIGAYINSFGVYGYKSGRSNNNYDWSFVFNAETGALSHSGTSITANKFIKSGSSSAYVLLGNGDHKALSEITSSSDKLTSINILTDLTFSELTSATWTDTDYVFDTTETATYAIQLTSTNLIASGIMSIYNNLEDSVGDEIPLHVYGTSGWRPYLRTNAKKLLISCSDKTAISGGRTVTIKIARIL